MLAKSSGCRTIHRPVFRHEVDQDARKSNLNDVALCNNFEQLVELGNSNKAVDANDQHIINIVDWLWQFAFDQRASDIPPLNLKRDLGTIRFRIDGVLHQVYQSSPRGYDSDDGAH